MDRGEGIEYKMCMEDFVRTGVVKAGIHSFMQQEIYRKGGRKEV